MRLLTNGQLGVVNAPAPSALVLLRLRWLQLRRALPTYGIVLLALAVVGAVWLLHKVVHQDAMNAPYIVVGAVLMVWGLHQRRADHHFLRRHVPQARVAMALEYSALILPVLLGLLFAGNGRPLRCYWLCRSCHGRRWRLPRACAARLRKRIPTQLFEWKSLLQSTHPWNLLLWLAALAFCWLPVLPMFLLGAIALMVTGAQEQCEPRAMLLATAPDARALLRSKVFGSIRMMVLLELPVLIGATIFQPDWWWLHGLFGLGLLVLVAYAVLLKYANYLPNERLSANGANVAVAAVFAILPGLLVVPLIMLLSEVRNARENLNTYFHAHHR